MARWVADVTGAAAARGVGGRLAVLAGAVLWGTAGVAVTLGPDAAPVWQLGLIRLALGAAGLLALAAVTGMLVRPPRGATVLLAGAALGAFQLGYFTAIQRAGVALGTLVAIGSAPLFAGLVEWFGYRIVPERRWWPATALGVLGLVLLLAPAGTATVDAVGIAAGLGAGLSFATFTVAGRRVLSGSAVPAAMMGWLLVVAAAALVPVAIVLAVATETSMAWLATGPGVASMGWLVVAATITAYWLFGRGLVGVPGSTATTLALAEPLTAALLGVVVLSERTTALEAAGGLLLAAALVVLSRRRR